MNNSFNEFVKKGLLFNLGFLALAIIVIMTYMDRNDLDFDILRSESGEALTIFSSSGQSTIKDNSHYSSNYDTYTIDEEDAFELVDHIVIDSTIEKIRFVHEDRDDINIIYKRELPDTNDYKITYRVHENNNTLYISAKVIKNKLLADITYNGLIEIYVPEDYHLESLSIDTDVFSFDDALLPDSIDDIYITGDVGKINLAPSSEIKKFTINTDVLDLTLTNDYSIRQLTIDSDSMEMNLETNASIDDLSITSSITDIHSTFNVAPETIDIVTDTCNMDLDFYDDVNQLDITTDFSDVNVNILDDDNARVYKDTDLVDFDSDIKIASDKSDANIIVRMSFGSFDIHAIH